MLLTHSPPLVSLYLIAASFNTSSFLFLFSTFIAFVDPFSLPPYLLLPGSVNDASATGMLLADTVDDDT
jgi:hypothetical protein